MQTVPFHLWSELCTVLDKKEMYLDCISPNPRMLQTDKGTEFLNAMFQRMLAVNDIHWYNT